MANEFEEYLKGSKDLKELCDKVNRYALEQNSLTFYLEDRRTGILIICGSFDYHLMVDFDINVEFVKYTISNYYRWINKETLHLNLHELVEDKNQLVDLNNYMNAVEDCNNKREEVRLAGVQFQANNPSVQIITSEHKKLKNELKLKTSELNQHYHTQVGKLRKQKEVMVESHLETIKDTCGFINAYDNLTKTSEELEESYNLVMDNTRVTFISEDEDGL